MEITFRLLFREYRCSKRKVLLWKAYGKMDHFCSAFFHNELELFGKAVDSMPSILEGEKRIITIGKYFTDRNGNRDYGLGYFFAYQDKWSADLLDGFHISSSRFLKSMRNWARDEVENTLCPDVVQPLWLLNFELAGKTVGLWLASLESPAPCAENGKGV